MKKMKSTIFGIFLLCCVFSLQSVQAVETRSKKLSIPTLQVGINYLGTNNKLFNCINDITHVKKILLKRNLKAKTKGNIVLMTDHKKGSRLYPTGDNIRSQIKLFVNRANALGRGFFQYSGHGTYVIDRSKDELDFYDEVLVPVDVYQKGYIKDDEIFTSLIRGLNKNVKLTMLIDCCNSGTVSDLPFKWNLDGSYSIEKKLGKKLLRNLPDVVMISGSKDDEYAYDGGKISGAKKGAGAMTAAFLTTLRAHNFKLNYKQLLEGMYAFLAKNNFKQTPQLSSTRKIKLTDSVRIGDVNLQ